MLYSMFWKNSRTLANFSVGGVRMLWTVCLEEGGGEHEMKYWVGPCA